MAGDLGLNLFNYFYGIVYNIIMRKKLIKIILLIIVSIIFLYFVNTRFTNTVTPLEDREQIAYPSHISINETVIEVRLAVTPAEKVRGLSGTSSLGDNEGVLFVFTESDFHGFWMKDMLFPIDIVWISGDFRIVHIEPSVPPESFPKIFKPSEIAQYVLEVNSGFAAENNFKAGDSVTFLTSL